MLVTKQTNGELDLVQIVQLNVSATDKETVIEQATQLLVENNCVDPAFAQSMKQRETRANTFLGRGIAIPHGIAEDRHLIKQDAVAILQIPQGVEWNPGQTAYMVVAIAAQTDGHITLLQTLTGLLQNDEQLQQLFKTDDEQLIVTSLNNSSEETEENEVLPDFAKKIEWTLDYPNGLHARPATKWIETARQFHSSIRIRHADKTADAKNLIALLRLGVRQGASLIVSAEGADADKALSVMHTLMKSLSAQEKADAELALKRQKSSPSWQAREDLAAIIGASAAPGMVVGQVYRKITHTLEVPDETGSLSDNASRLHRALKETKAQLQILSQETEQQLGKQEAKIFLAHIELLNDTDLITLVCQIMADGHGVAWAWNTGVERMANRLSALGNPVLAARATDLIDVGNRVLFHIAPELSNTTETACPDHPYILISDDLTPSDTAALDITKVIGLATSEGGPTSHTAILARTLGLPALVGGGQGLLDIANGSQVILDGTGGRIYIDPNDDDINSAQEWITKLQAQQAKEAETRQLPAKTTDGTHILIGANINLPDQVAEAISEGAEGVGLMRTEFLYLERNDEPSEDEQYETYLAMSKNLEGRELIVRTLDIGGDKQAPQLALPQEDNPFLGVRGSRLLLRRADLLQPQLRALYRALKDGAKLSIMFPMVTSVTEFLKLRAICEDVRESMAAPSCPIGVMIEVPAAALEAETLAKHADFFSIGTNDLTQYCLAMDRQNPTLAAEADSLHPAVLKLIKLTVDGAKDHNCWVGACGGIAGDPHGAAILSGLGVTELSMSPLDIPAVKARLRQSSMDELKALAQKALEAETSEAVRQLKGGE
ncbi:multiphosphoryl transfer protein [Methylophaga thalassica]|uniref:phosphoenolpyruvate--protein phosphotransferase n=1 Tax=Methylophaga thalassica TaxID=40223 RepID=A0ABQ5TU42_9GAMM|nr:phosphoenolpyruvate--protein phosphotransferase [Methylophaga thalassica]GLP99079.1 multiphosphoryl transfer protein [Methylophaga thalassica]